MQGLRVHRAFGLVVLWLTALRFEGLGCWVFGPK